MRAILGIGNPGSRYEHTRHNIGFMILDAYAENKKLSFKKSIYDYVYAGSQDTTSPFVLIKPTTFVNRSGMAAIQVQQNYNLQIEDFLVIADDVNLEEGMVRIRKSGGNGGHNGLASIIYHLESKSFPRLRFGIGMNFSNGDMANYVLKKLSNKNLKELGSQVEFCIELIDNFIFGGIKNLLEYFSVNSHRSKLSSQKEN